MAADARVVYVAADRVWLEKRGVLCQARVFGDAAPAPPPAPTASPMSGAAQPSALERELAGKIAKTGPNEFQIDRGAVDRILEAQAELMKTPLAPEKEGDRVVGFRLVRIRPGSVLAALGLETGDRLVSLNGIEVTSPRAHARGVREASIGDARPPHDSRRAQRQADEHRLPRALSPSTGFRARHRRGPHREVNAQGLSARNASTASRRRSIPATTRADGTLV